MKRLDLGRAGCGLFGRQLVLGRARLELVELELHLVEKPLLALRTLAEERAPELLDHQLQGGDLRFGVRHLRHGVASLGLRNCGPLLGLAGLGLCHAASAAFSASISDPSGMPEANHNNRYAAMPILSG